MIRDGSQEILRGLALEVSGVGGWVRLDCYRKILVASSLQMAPSFFIDLEDSVQDRTLRKRSATVIFLSLERS